MRGRGRIRAGYNSGRDADTALLERLIPQHDQRFLANMIQECIRFTRRAQALGLSSPSDDRAPSTLVPWTVKGARAEPRFYTIEFTTSVVMYAPPVFAPLHIRRSYSRHLDVEYLPYYLANLNRVVMSKDYLGKSNPNAQDAAGDGLFNRLDFEGEKRPTVSSTNILLSQSAKPRVQRSLQDEIRKCFEHRWWHPPASYGRSDASCVHSMIYHTSSCVSGIVQLRKTLARIISTGRSETVRIVPGGRAAGCVHADVALLVDDGEDIVSERRKILMTESASASVKEGTVMNAVIAARSDGEMRTPVIIGHAARAMKIGCIKPAVSLSIWKILRELPASSGLTFVADVSEITRHVLRMLDGDATESGVFYPDLVWKCNKNSIEKQIDELFPLYMRYGSSVYQMPPAAISFLAASGPGALPKSVRDIPRLLDLVSPDATKWGERAQSALRARTGGAVASSWLARLISSVPTIAAQAALSRIFSEHAASPRMCADPDTGHGISNRLA